MACLRPVMDRSHSSETQYTALGVKQTAVPSPEPPGERRVDLAG